MFERHGEITPPWGDPWVGRCRRPSSRTPAFSHLSIIRRMTPSVTRWSRKLVEVTLDVDIDAPPHAAAHAGAAQSVERLVGGAAGPEAIRAGEEVLLVNRLQHHRDGPLCHLVFEGRDAERPLRAVRLRDVGPAHRRRMIAARPNAAQEVR